MGPAIPVTAPRFVADETIEGLARHNLLPRGAGGVNRHGIISQTCNSILMSIWFHIRDADAAIRVPTARCRGTRRAGPIGQGLDRCNLLPRGASLIVNGHHGISQTCNSTLMSIWFHIREADG